MAFSASHGSYLPALVIELYAESALLQEGTESANEVMQLAVGFKTQKPRTRPAKTCAGSTHLSLYTRKWHPFA